jgi:hypothetical protein
LCSPLGKTIYTEHNVQTPAQLAPWQSSRSAPALVQQNDHRKSGRAARASLPAVGRGWNRVGFVPRCCTGAPDTADGPAAEDGGTGAPVGAAAEAEAGSPAKALRESFRGDFVHVRHAICNGLCCCGKLRQAAAD